MKIKLIAVAALAVCGSGAFAAGPTLVCTSPETSSNALVNNCAPEVVVYMAGASAQQPGLDTLLSTTDVVFDNTKAMAKITKGTLLSSTENFGSTKTTIYYGFGSTKSGSAGKRIAVVYNTANGSFAGVKQMVEATGTGAGEEKSLGLVTAAMIKANTALGCTGTASAATSGVYNFGVYTCNQPFNYLTTAHTGGVKGVQLALADVAPSQAAIGVLTPGKWTAAKFPTFRTAVQGFGVVVNDKTLQALIARDVAAKRLPDTCVAANIYGSNDVVNLKVNGRAASAAGVTPVVTAIAPSNTSATILTAACQPTIQTSDMVALVTGKATPSMISGNLADDATDGTGKKLTYFRRVPMSGTQASVQIAFAGQAAIEGFDAKKVAANPAIASGYVTPVLGAPDTSASATAGGYVWNGGHANYFVKALVNGGDVVTQITLPAEADNYAIGVVSLENVYTPVVTAASTSATGLAKASGLKGASYVRLDGISPNFKADGSIDLKQRVGMQSGYQFQYEMVAVKNAANKAPQLAVVDSIVTALADPANDLAGLTYVGASDAAKKAKFYRGGEAKNYAPLTVAP